MPLRNLLFGGSKAGQDIAQITVGFPWKGFTYKELAAATNNFSPNNMIDEDGWTKDYKGVLSDGTPVAVRQWDEDRYSNEFRNVLEVLSRVHHKNIQGFIGCCTTPNKLITVHEFVSNRSLEFHLHENDQNILDWAARVKIAYSCAKALEHLHDDISGNLRIVHRDVKPSSILVDSSFESKLRNFSIAIVLSDESYREDKVAGTIGYVDPEYLHSSVVTKKVDIFSFGVVLHELITGKKPVERPHYNSSWEESVMLLLEAVHSDNYITIVDPRLRGIYILEEVKQMATCAIMSVHPKSYYRPQISQVVRALEGLSTIIVPDKESYLTRFDGLYSDEEMYLSSPR